MATGGLRVLYLAGYGHSGSTLLNIMLGQHHEVMGAGELFRLAGPAWEGGEFCSCGSALPECEVWRAVVERWKEICGADVLRDYPRLQERCEGRFSLPAGHAVLERYAVVSRTLFESIAEVTGRSVVVDSSKLPARAAALARVPGIDLRLVHLVRDGRGVAWSLRRRLARDPRAGLQAEKRQRSALRTGLMWMLANLATERIARRLGPERAVRLRYETLVAEPAESLARMGAVAGLDIAGMGAVLAQGRPLTPGHVMAGNRLRMADRLTLRVDSEWQRLLPAGQRRLIEGLCGPLMRRYGYKPLVEPS